MGGRTRTGGNGALLGSAGAERCHLRRHKHIGRGALAHGRRDEELSATGGLRADRRGQRIAAVHELHGLLLYARATAAPTFGLSPLTEAQNCQTVAHFAPLTSVLKVNVQKSHCRRPPFDDKLAQAAVIGCDDSAGSAARR